MTKYIDADLLRKEIEFAKSVYDNPKRVVAGVADAFRQDGRAAMCDDILKKLDSLQQEKPEVDLEKFTERMDSWKARFNSPDDIPIKATMAFTARMFYMYPQVAREWYESLPKATQD